MDEWRTRLEGRGGIMDAGPEGTQSEAALVRPLSDNAGNRRRPGDGKQLPGLLLRLLPQ